MNKNLAPWFVRWDNAPRWACVAVAVLLLLILQAQDVVRGGIDANNENSLALARRSTRPYKIVVIAIVIEVMT